MGDPPQVLLSSQFSFPIPLCQLHAPSLATLQGVRVSCESRNTTNTLENNHLHVF